MATIPDDFVFHLLHQLSSASKMPGWESLEDDADRLRSFLVVNHGLESTPLDHPPE